MTIKRISLLFLLIFSVMSCIVFDNSGEPQGRYNDEAVPSTYSELADYVSAVADLQSDYQQMMNLQERTFENTIKCFHDLNDKGREIRGVLNFLQIVTSDADMRTLASETSLQLSTWFFQLVIDPALHEIMQEFIDRKDDYDIFEQEIISSVETMLTDYGMGMDAADRNVLNYLNVQTETLVQQINYLNIINDPAVQIPELFTDLIGVQTSFAGYYGYDNFADYKISKHMPGSAEVVENFLLEAINELHVPYDGLVEKLKAIKAEATGEPDAVIYFQDRIVYLDKLVEEEYGISDFSTKYASDGAFEVDDIINTLFSIYENYFDIELTKSTPPGNVWNEDVEYYEMRDRNTGAPLGSFYLDLFVREGKHSLSSIYSLLPEHTDDDGKSVKPVYVWIMNINKESKVSIYNSIGMFHEFGHLLQRILSSTDISSEYVEVFSQLFEEFFYEREVINSLLGDNVWTDEEYESWMNAIAVYNLDQNIASFALYLYNLRLYNDYTSEIDVLALQDEILGNYYLPMGYQSTKVINVANQINYPSAYYSYGWSKGIALDVADFIRSNGGFLNKENTEILRDKFYALKEPLDKNAHIRKVLGRDWNMDAFYRYYGAE